MVVEKPSESYKLMIIKCILMDSLFTENIRTIRSHKAILSVMITCLLQSHPTFNMYVLVFYKMFFGTVMVFTSPSLSVFRFRCTLKLCVFLLTSNTDAELGCF